MINIAVTGTSGYIVDSLVPFLSNALTDVGQVRKISVRTSDYSFKGIDVLIHTAGIIPGKAKTNEDYYLVNYQKTKEVALKAKSDGVKHIIYISTIAVYGRVPSTKSFSFLQAEARPDTPYGESKLLAEASIQELAEKSFKVTILRVPDVYGGQNIDYLQRYINIKTKYKKLGINPWAYVDNKRSAVHIDNLCMCIAMVIQKEWTGTLIPHDSMPLSTFEYVELLAELDQCKLVPAKLCGLILRIINGITGKFEFFYGSFDASDDAQLPYQILSARDACITSINEYQEDKNRVDEC